MDIIPLLHRIPAGLGKGDQIPRLSKKGEPIPADWVPADLHYVPEAFPTPFGRAEATRIALESLDKASGNKLVIAFNTMLLGVAAGELNVEPFHLKHADYDNLGRALLKVDAEVEYLAWIRDKSGRPFGVAAPDCLFWAHSRREEGEWNELNERLQPRKQRALELLADLRESLTRAGRWAPGKIAWQIGLLALTEKTPPSPDLSRLAAAMTMGPVRVRMPKGDGTAETVYAPLYLPRLPDVEGFDASTWFFGLLSCNLRDAADGGQALELIDPSSTKTAARIFMPSGTAESLPIYLGMGRIFPGQAVASGPPNFELVSQGLDRIRTELGRVGLEAPKDGSDVAPIVPDVLRFLAIAKSRLSRATTGWPPGCRFTSRATAELARAEVPSPGDSDTACVPVDGGAAFGLVDRVGTTPVLDLRALGWVLFQAFTGARQPNTLAALVVSTDKHPLEPAAGAYTEVSGPAGTLAKTRLATLQRFISAYSDPVSDLEIALSRAAASFARWAAGHEVAPIGRRASRDGVVATAASVGSAPLLVARDPIAAAATEAGGRA